MSFHGDLGLEIGECGESVGDAVVAEAEHEGVQAVEGEHRARVVGAVDPGPLGGWEHLCPRLCQ